MNDVHAVVQTLQAQCAEVAQLLMELRRLSTRTAHLLWATREQLARTRVVDEARRALSPTESHGG
jgi:hypothetical protein